jgi:diaminopimelate decarboxylase
MLALTASEPFTDLGAEEVQSLAERHGTPLFVYDDAYFRASVSAFLTTWRDAFPTGRAYLSYKTNYMPALCRSAHALGMGADVVSGFEMEHALRLCAARDIVFNGPLKRADELERAARNGITINIDLAEELETLEALRSSGRIATARLGLRVNPGLPVFAARDRSFVAAHAAKQRSAKFGWPLDDGLARHMAERISASGFSFETVHAHLNSQITDPALFLAALEPVLGFVAGLRASGTQIRELNVGGGFGVPGMQRSKRGWWSALKTAMGEAPAGDPDEAFDMTAFAGALAGRLRENGLDDLCIGCEPGRYLMSASMALVTRVAGIKMLPEKRWVVIDGGLNILPTAAFGERRRLRFLRSGQDLPQRDDDPGATLGGPLCFEGDVVMESAKVPASLAGGDLVVLSDAGAYTVSRSTNFNQLRAAVAMRDGRDGTLVWRRETYDDVFSFSD